MFGGGGYGILVGRRDQCNSGQMIRFSEQPARVLMDTNQGSIFEKVVCDATIRRPLPPP
jgi:hypothetical protein